MLSLPVEKIDAFFELIGSKEALYIPVTNNAGTADFARWSKGTKLSDALKTVRSAKEFFFPKAEHMVSYKRKGMEVTVEDPRKELEDFVVFGVRACDAKSFGIVDAVYIGDPKYVDTYYKNRREHGTIITLACNEPAQTCFCKAYGIDAADPAGDVSCWCADGKYFFKANTDKGTKLIESAKAAFTDAKDDVVENAKKDIRAKIEKLPFSSLDLSKFKGKDMMKIFNSKVWESLSESCLGCGTCTYVCPTCMCFDVRDFASDDGIKQVRCWDSCMFSDFTQMAAANPRLTQKERFRQRFMHKLMYYPMAHSDIYSCVGCGRCLESCPINMNIVKVVKTYNDMGDEGGKE